MATGMEGYAAQAGALGAQAQGLRAAVDNGQLVMDPDAAERVARVYEEKADKVRHMGRDVQRLLTNDAYGACFIGRALEKKFNDKVTGAGGTAGLVPILRQVEEILRNMAQAYRDSARNIQNTDDEHARQLKRNL